MNHNAVNNNNNNNNNNVPNSYRLEELFRACDYKGKGDIGPTEFRELCVNFGIDIQDANSIFTDLDHDGDGKISFEDFAYGFRDFLTPGSRRGSLQVALSSDNSHETVLAQMEKRHATAKKAWKNFTNNYVEGTSSLPQIHDSETQLENIIEDLRCNDAEGAQKLEFALTQIWSNLETLKDEYRTLEDTFKREREMNAARLAALGEELDHQLAKTEAKVKAEAKNEAQKQMDSERKRIAVEMETQIADFSSQLRTFRKVEEWLAEENRDKKGKTAEELQRLQDAEGEQRKLRTALIEAQLQNTLLQNHIVEQRKDYMDLYRELHTEKLAATDYKTQCDAMQNHLSVLSEANRMLFDANDCLSSISLSPSHSSINMIEAARTVSASNSLERNLKPPVDNSSDIGSDSGRGTLLDEIKCQGDSSPLPSGIWTSGGHQNSPVNTNSPSPRTFTPESDLDTPLQASNLEYNKVHPRKLSRDPPLPGHFPQRTFKVILAGDAAVGKTTFIERACNNCFVSNLSSTIGVDFRVKALEVEGDVVALQLWDTAGQERFRSLTKSYFRRADGVILLYDVTNERTFVNIRHWIQNVEEGAGRKVPIVLCGNKVDLREAFHGNSCVNTSDGLKLSKQCGALFTETSPKTGQNVVHALVLLAQEMSLYEDAEIAKNSVQLRTADEESLKVKKSCCGGGTQQQQQQTGTGEIKGKEKCRS